MDFLQRIGVDVDNPNDVRELADTIRWARAERERQAKQELERLADRRDRRSRMYSVGYGGIATAIGAIITWLISHPPRFP